MTRVLQIVPRLPPNICGVGDYALILARALRDGHGILSGFLTCDPAAQPSATGEFSIAALAKRTAGDFAAKACSASPQVQAQALIIHFSGYGYEKRGLPCWLTSGLSSLKKQAPHLRIVTMFHELSVSGPVTSRAFWLGLCQNQIARKLARLSDAVRTNRWKTAQWLKKSALHEGAPIVHMPVFSNMGEKMHAPPPSARASRMVVLQPPPAESPQGILYWRAFAGVLRQLNPTEIVVAGRASSVPDIPGLRCTGVLPTGEMSTLLASARFGFCDYYDGYLGKSGIFAAFAAHCAASILANANDSTADGLHEGRDYFSAADVSPLLDPVGADACAANLVRWYESHSIAATARSYAEQFTSLC